MITRYIVPRERGNNHMKELSVTITGISPLLMHSCRGVNPTDPLVIEKKKITSKRKKTEEDTLAILDIDYMLALYHDPEIGPYLPAECVEACCRESAKKNKQGKLVQTALFVSPDRIPLDYTGPREVDQLVNDNNFRDVRAGNIQRSKVLICRPRFNHWRATFTVFYDETLIDTEDVKEILIRAGQQIGICDYRPRYGKFEVLFS